MNVRAPVRTCAELHPVGEIHKVDDVRVTADEIGLMELEEVAAEIAVKIIAAGSAAQCVAQKPAVECVGARAAVHESAAAKPDKHRVRAVAAVEAV